MADRKITDLTALAAGSQATGDLLTIVDVSEGAAADKNKKITVESLFKGIPGDVGIGTTSPSTLLEIKSDGTAANEARLSVNEAYNSGSSGFGIDFKRTYNTGGANQDAGYIRMLRDGGDSNAGLTFATGNRGSVSERLRIDSSGNVGIGVSSLNSSSRLTLLESAGNAQTLEIKGANSGGVGSQPGIKFTANNGDNIGGIYGDTNADAVILQTGGTERMRIDSSGNVGVGTTSPVSKLDLGSDTGVKLTLLQNNYSLGVESNELRIASNQSTTFYSGGHSGTERMRIDSSGVLLVGLTSAVSIGGTPADINGTEIGRGYINISRDDTQAADHILFGKNGSIASSIGTSTTNSLTFKTGTTERMRIDSSGNVGIGSSTINQTSSNRTVLGINGSSNALLNFNHGNTLAGFMYGASDEFRMEANGTRPLIFRGNSTERMRIDSSGRLLIGSTSARANFYHSVVSPQVQQEGAGDFDRQAAIISSSSTGHFGAAFILAHQKSGSKGGNTALANGDVSGLLSFQANDSSHFLEHARIQAFVDGASGTDDMPGALQFFTAADGAQTVTERMRITSNGSLNVAAEGGSFGGGNATARFSSVSAASSNYANQQVIAVHNKGTSSTRYMMSFGDSATYTERGYITWDGQNMALVNASDQRLKTNISNVSSTIESVKQIQVRSFDWLENNEHVDFGFVAQELNQVAPEAVNVGIDDEDGNIDKPWTVGNASLVPRLTKALQEAIAKIETLETSNADLLARVTALEAG